MSRVLRFPKNLKGKDYVIGDIHGAYDTVWQSMILSAPRVPDPARSLVDARADEQVSCKPFFNISAPEECPAVSPR